MKPISKTKLKKIGLKVHEDWRDTYRAGFKFAHWEMRGIPLRLSIGERDIANQKIEVTRRDSGEKVLVAIDNLTQTLKDINDDIQKQLFLKARQTLQNNTFKIDDFRTFKDTINSKNGGFILAHWDGNIENRTQN